MARRRERFRNDPVPILAKLLDSANKALYIGIYFAIRLYIWSLIDEIECVRCSASCRQAVADQIRQRPCDARRRKRGLTIIAVAERMGVAKNTYLRAEKGDPKVGLGVYAMALFVLGFGDPLGALIDVSRDDTGLLLDEERLPKRVRMKKAQVPQP